MNIKNVFKKIQHEVYDYKILLRNVPALVVVFFITSVVLMNLLANKEIYTGVSWLALDCGLTMSWLSFLCMDMLTRRFGPKASIKLSLLAIGVNLFVCMMLYFISAIPGNWGEYYTFNNDIANQALNNTIGGTWYVLLGSTIALAVSSVVNAITNAGIGKILKGDGFKSYAARSYISTFLAQFVDNFIFSIIVSHTFFGWSLLQCVTCSLTGCLVELICEIIFSPFGYKVCKQWESEQVGQAYIEHSINVKSQVGVIKSVKEMN